MSTLLLQVEVSVELEQSLPTENGDRASEEEEEGKRRILEMGNFLSSAETDSHIFPRKPQPCCPP